MNIYTIILQNPSESAWSNIKTNWPNNHHILDERMAFVSGDNLLTKDISEKIGIGKDLPGIVIQMDYYSGFGNSSLVEWMSKLQ